MKNEKFKNYLLIETNYHVLFRTNCHLTTSGLKYTGNLPGHGPFKTLGALVIFFSYTVNNWMYIIRSLIGNFKSLDSVVFHLSFYV